MLCILHWLFPQIKNIFFRNIYININIFGQKQPCCGLCLSSTLACLLIFCRNAVLIATFVRLWLLALFVQCLEKYSLHMFYITSLSGDEMVLYIWRWGERNKDLLYFCLLGLHTAKRWVKKQQNYTAKLSKVLCHHVLLKQLTGTGTNTVGGRAQK